MSLEISVFTQIYEDFRSQREGLLSQGFWALLVHRLAHMRMQTRPGLRRRIWAVLNRLAIKWIEVTCGISIGESAVIGRRLIIEHFGGIIIHGRTIIGDDCLIRQGVTLGNRSEGAPEDAPTLGNGVVIGAGAKVLGRITIGEGAIIGANAVVVRDVAPGDVVVGIPARSIRRRYG